MIRQSIYLTAAQAADALGVRRATLYAYASRGQLRSEPVPGRTRERRYVRQDIERLRDRKEARRDPAKAAAKGLEWGSPVLESGITLIRDGRLYYRGQDAIELAERASLETVAELLWQSSGLFDQPPVRSPRIVAKGDALSLCQATLPLAGGADPAGYELRPDGVRRTGVRIVRLMASVIAGRDVRGPIHTLWGAKVSEVVRSVLVLCADHELNVSAFTARCAASAGASPYDVVAAALATLKGHRHGGQSERAAAMLREPRAIESMLRRGETVPGFGHPLYPEGDPRAEMLLRLAGESRNRAIWRRVSGLAKRGHEVLGLHPTLDFGLAAVSLAYRLPEHAPIILFALGRTVGWIAHAIEQYSSGQLIRPRAHYTGPMP
ncbi:MAG TPA: citrate synthase family protein [Gemmatimonadaceae bacterium]|nr:citrate synthase family protein [Gemmatimonadaceae bacterium]